MDLTNVPANAKAGLIAMNADKPLADLDDALPILNRYEAGETIEVIAASLGISSIAVYRWLTRKAEAQWKEYQAARALADYESAEQELRTATDGVTLGRARELLKSQQWKLERVLRKIYGPDAQQVNVQININDVAKRIADLEAELTQRT